MAAENSSDSTSRYEQYNRIASDLREAYLADQRPWVVGFSGGKDSTALLEMVWYVMIRLPESSRRKPVYVLASDTRVETPLISKRIGQELRLIQEAAFRDKLPVTTRLVYPKLN
ncbi:MAG TPA: DNA phosphorothioation system sulfurtransferase DndC, partial [Candidatus Latescibacteria bacterium]|nr:DNA phosphorothioation system sulfurtransferase DndC [Candidatus Latescibacterota bacterium]